jgi:hypothetical protein
MDACFAIYFNDPDGNQLEFISILEGERKPNWVFFPMKNGCYKHKINYL